MLGHELVIVGNRESGCRAGIGAEDRGPNFAAGADLTADYLPRRPSPGRAFGDYLAVDISPRRSPRCRKSASDGELHRNISGFHQTILPKKPLT
jgi:hypothetical protein